MKKTVIILIVIVVIITIAYFAFSGIKTQPSDKISPPSAPGAINKNADWLAGEVQKAKNKEAHDKWADWYFVYSYANTTPDVQQWANEQFTHTGTGAWPGYNDMSWYNKWAGATGGAAAKGGNT